MNIERSTPLKAFILIGLAFLVLALATQIPLFGWLAAWAWISAFIYFIRSY